MNVNLNRLTVRMFALVILIRRWGEICLMYTDEASFFLISPKWVEYHPYVRRFNDGITDD